MKLRLTVYAELSDQGLHLSLDEQRIHFAPYINVGTDRGKALPVAIGEKRELPDATLLGFFDFDAISKLGIEKTTLLQWALDYGIGRLFEKFWFPVLRPLVIFRNHKNLSAILGDDYKKTLETVTMRAGAGKVEFD